MNDEIARKLGFADVDEFFRLVSTADMSTPEHRAAFKRWQAEDGSKAGLITLGTAEAERSMKGDK